MDTRTQQPAAKPVAPAGQTPTHPAAKSSVKKKFPMMLIAIIVGALLVVGGGGYGLYASQQKKAEVPAQAAAKVKVGFMMAQTGGAASMGLGAIKGVQLAMKQLGADNIELVQVDSKCDPKAGTTYIDQLIAQHVVAIIGEGCSTASIAALPAANAAKIPMISPSSSSPKLTIADDYFFRTVPSDDFQARYLAEYAYKKGYRTVGQFHTAVSPFTDIFKATFEKLGGKIVVSNRAESGDINLTVQAKELAAAKPDAITVFTNQATSAVAIINLLHKQGYQGAYFGSDALYSKALAAETAEASEGHLVVSNFALGTKAFKQSMVNTYQSSEAYAAPQAYDALHAIQIAVQRGATTGEEVKNALSTIEFDGASGYHIKFDKNGEMSAPESVKYSLLEVKDGDFVEIAQ